MARIDCGSPNLVLSLAELVGLLQRNAKDKFGYVSGPITSSGARRLFDPSQMMEIIGTNRAAANLIIQALVAADALPFDDHLSPYDLGPRYKPTGKESERPVAAFDESDYLMLWVAMIAGLPQAAIAEMQKFIESDAELDLDLLNNKSANRAERVSHYQRLQELILQFIFAQAEINPIAAMVSLPDALATTGSLGAQLEYGVARALGVPVYEVTLNPKHPTFQEWIEINPLFAFYYQQWLTNPETSIMPVDLQQENVAGLRLLR